MTHFFYVQSWFHFFNPLLMNLLPNIVLSSCFSGFWLKICSRLSYSNALGHHESCEIAFSFLLFCRLRVQDPRSLLHCADIPLCCNWWLFMQNFIVSCCIYCFEDVLSNRFWHHGCEIVFSSLLVCSTKGSGPKVPLA